jgi:hypothetical protein
MAPEIGEPIHHLPLIPATVLKKHCFHEPPDTRFRSAARLLQALWREDRDLPIGSYDNDDGKCHRLGSCIWEAAEKALTPKIAHIARRETAYREIGEPTDFECSAELARQTRSSVRRSLAVKGFSPLR